MDFNSTINATWKCFSILFNERYYTEKQQAITIILFALLSFVLEMHVYRQHCAQRKSAGI